ncbi:UbiH/UbiF family hydroxylase [Paracoccus sp. S-4012]|uniref:UbiH/UbiF family hydroxylase n=1 Tax=Paracoccus sp. S-4012 TaxID=2665648 RepID=UPI0012AF5F2D|nr:UbiH/UbiF family hydroxylase [Paracoccus sp. S-4012]MRX50867.1 UbiH/UbiF family hydroxylase [Paracoccus sp. S-4012]
MAEAVEVLVAGGGPAGLIATAAFGTAGRRVLCVDPAPPVTDEAAGSADLRSTAFLTPSLSVLRAAGLWEDFAPHSMPLEVMRIVDAGGAEAKPRLTCDFDSADLSSEPFGWNIPNWAIRREALARLEALPDVRFEPGVAAVALHARDDRAFVTLSDGRRIEAQLVVAADGRNSAMRGALGIGVTTRRYGQKALAFAVTHEQPHGNVSTEIHRSGGPFTLVPLPDRDGRPCSAVIWMERGPEVARLAALPRDDFEAALNQRAAGILGRLTLATRLTTWPIIAQIADRFSGPRTALIAEAAHVVPPIGAQGLNMSLADLGELLRLSGNAPGSREGLDAYDRRRRPEAWARLLGIDALNRASMAGARPLRDLRAAGLGLLHGIAPVRRLAMRAGLGAR